MGLRPTFNPYLNFMIALSLVSFSVTQAASLSYQSSLDVQSQSSFSRLKLSLDESFKPVLKDVANGFEISIPGATLMDLGVQFGGEEEFNRYLAKISDSRVSKITASESESGVVLRGKYKFPTGPQALAHPQMDHFDFRQTDQGKFVIDFWFKKGITLIEQERLNRLSSAAKQKADQALLKKKEAERRAIREKRMAESKNALAFCDMPYDRENTVFLKFHPAHPTFSFTPYFPENIPDHRFEYTEPKGKTEEEEMVRLALKLSGENNHALVIKTVDFLAKEYPKSRFLNEMRFLKVNAFYRLEMVDKGRSELVELAKRTKGTEVGMQSSAFLAVQYYNKREWLAALDAFNTIRRDNPRHPLNWLFRYGSAEALYEIKQSEQAAAEFAWVAQNATKSQIKAEAAFKRGDVFFDRNQYAQAISAYSSALEKFKDHLTLYPQVLMNLGESYFQLEEYKKADAHFKHYLEIGRNQPTAWRASLRVAEIKALNQKQNAEIETAFTDTINRYPLTPGAVIARLRLLPCGNHGGFDVGGMQRFIKSPDVQNFEGGEDLYSSSFKELVGLTEVRSLLSFGEDQKAVDQGIAHLRENPTVEVRRLLEQAMAGGIKRMLEAKLGEDLQKGALAHVADKDAKATAKKDEKSAENSAEKENDEVGAIAIYEKYGDYLPPAFQDPVVDDLRMRIAKFASEKKLNSFALKLIEPYRQMNEAEHRELVAAVEKNLALEGSKEQDERNYIEAKTLWNSDSFTLSDPKQGEVFLSRLSAISQTSAYSWERDFLKALYYSEKHEDETALKLAGPVIAKLNQAHLNKNEKAQVWFWYAELSQRAGDLNAAERGFRETRVLVSEKATAKLSTQEQSELSYQHVKSAPSISYLYTLQGEMLERQQKWKEAVALYTEAIENKVGGNHVLYAHAQALLKVGGRESTKTASRSLEKIKQSQDDDVWKKLAQKTLEEIAKEGKNDDQRKQ